MKKLLLFMLVGSFILVTTYGCSEESMQKMKLEALIDYMDEAETSEELQGFYTRAQAAINETEFESVKDLEGNVKAAHKKAKLRVEKEEVKLQAIGAYLMAKKFVMERLKAPTTAKFPNHYDDGVYIDYDKSTKKATVQLFVDAQNSFGAMIRSKFQVDLMNISGNSWMLVNIQKVN